MGPRLSSLLFLRDLFRFNWRRCRYEIRFSCSRFEFFLVPDFLNACFIAEVQILASGFTDQKQTYAHRYNDPNHGQFGILLGALRTCTIVVGCRFLFVVSVGVDEARWGGAILAQFDGGAIIIAWRRGHIGVIGPAIIGSAVISSGVVGSTVVVTAVPAGVLVIGWQGDSNVCSVTVSVHSNVIIS